MKSLRAALFAPLTALLAQILTNQQTIIANQEKIMGTQAQDDANLAAGIAQIQADQAAERQAIADATARVLAALQAATAGTTDPAVQSAVSALGDLHTAITTDIGSLGAIAPATGAAPASSAPSSDTAVP